MVLYKEIYLISIEISPPYLNQTPTSRRDGYSCWLGRMPTVQSRSSYCILLSAVCFSITTWPLDKVLYSGKSDMRKLKALGVCEVDNWLTLNVRVLGCTVFPVPPFL